MHDRAYENNTPQLLSILNKILAHMKNLRCVCGVSYVPVCSCRQPKNERAKPGPHESCANRTPLSSFDSEVFAMDSFMAFVDLFLKDKTKTEVCKLLLENFALHQKETTSDPVVLNNMMYFGRVRFSCSFSLSRMLDFAPEMVLARCLPWAHIGPMRILDAP